MRWFSLSSVKPRSFRFRMQMLYDSSPDNAREIRPDEVQLQDRFERACASARSGSQAVSCIRHLLKCCIRRVLYNEQAAQAGSPSGDERGLAAA
jgi:hypothetical protein